MKYSCSFQNLSFFWKLRTFQTEGQSVSEPARKKNYSFIFNMSFPCKKTKKNNLKVIFFKKTHIKGG